jgi:hypothetical protein
MISRWLLHPYVIQAGMRKKGNRGQKKKASAIEFVLFYSENNTFLKAPPKRLLVISTSQKWVTWWPQLSGNLGR